MKKGLFLKMLVVFLVVFLLSYVLYLFSFWLQENFYGTPNILKPIEDMLGNQTSATTYFVVLYMSAMWTLCFMLFAEYFNFLESKIGIIGLYLWPLVPLAVYDYYEYYQMLHPTYPDNHILDLVMSVLATITLWVVMTIRIKTLSPEAS